MKLAFIERAPDNPDLPAGDIGGDHQVSDAWERQFAVELPGGTFAIVSVAHYVEDDTLDESLAEATKQGRRLTRQTEYLVCTDLNDPGGTELNADYRYNTVEDAETTEEAAKAATTAVTPEEITWPDDLAWMVKLSA